MNATLSTNLRQWFVATVTIFYLSGPADAGPLFQEDSVGKGLGFDNSDVQSAVWVDVNGDGWQDLWLAAHQMHSKFYRSRLYISDEGRRFSNVWPDLHVANFRTDAHGTYWADFDNDGDQDLLVVAGGNAARKDGGHPNILFENRGDTLVDIAADYGLQNFSTRGRVGFWFDEDGDGLLDILTLASKRTDGKTSENQLFLQRENSFEVSAIYPAELRHRSSRQLLLVPKAFSSAVGEPIKASAAGLKEPVDTGLLLALGSKRVVQFDYDNNGELDHLVYVPTKVKKEVCYAQRDNGAMVAYMPGKPGEEKRHFVFQTSGPIKFNSRWLKGVSSWHGNTKSKDECCSQYLSPFDGTYHASSDSNPMIGEGVRVSHDTESQVWRIDVNERKGKTSAMQFVLAPAAQGVTIATSMPRCDIVSPFDPYVVDGKENRRRDLIYKGLSGKLYPRAIVSGDFDNDTDIDLYVARGTPLEDMPDVVMLNNGNGTFEAQPVDAANTYEEGGIYVTEIIPGPHMSVADYNNDGFLDLFITAAHYYSWLDGPRLMAGTPNRLLTNLGNENNWLSVELVGTKSNRDGIGSQVILEAGMQRQVRYQTGGIDSFDQHSKLIHFGLASFEKIESVKVIWPDGATSEIRDVVPNKTLKLVEP